MFHTIQQRTGIAIVVALLATALAPLPAQATPGLYGAQDAQYDGVYRQSLIIAGLKANKSTVPSAATQWLAAQQCADGGFQALRTGNACAAPDPVNYVGEDTNSTAAAAIALVSVGDNKRASKAISYLRSTVNADGGIPYYKGGSSDVNSTAMAMLAFRANGVTPASVHRGDYTLVDFLITAAVGCEGSASARGGLGYMPSKPNVVSDMATAQALAALASKLPWQQKTVLTARSLVTPSVRCPGSLSDDEASLRDYVSGYLARALASHQGLIPNAFGEGSDITSTAWAVIGLAGADRGVAQARAATAAIRSQVATYIKDETGAVVAGRIGMLLLLAAARGESAKSFGGVNLVAAANSALGT